MKPKKIERVEFQFADELHPQLTSGFRIGVVWEGSKGWYIFYVPTLTLVRLPDDQLIKALSRKREQTTGVNFARAATVNYSAAKEKMRADEREIVEEVISLIEGKDVNETVLARIPLTNVRIATGGKMVTAAPWKPADKERVSASYDDKTQGVVTQPGDEQSEIKWDDGTTTIVPNSNLRPVAKEEKTEATTPGKDEEMAKRKKAGGKTKKAKGAKAPKVAKVDPTSVAGIFKVRDGSTRHKLMKKLHDNVGKAFPVKDVPGGPGAVKVMAKTMKQHKVAFHFALAGEGKDKTVALKKGAA